MIVVTNKNIYNFHRKSNFPSFYDNCFHIRNTSNNWNQPIGRTHKISQRKELWIRNSCLKWLRLQNGGQRVSSPTDNSDLCLAKRIERIFSILLRSFTLQFLNKIYPSLESLKLKSFQISQLVNRTSAEAYQECRSSWPDSTKKTSRFRQTCLQAIEFHQCQKLRKLNCPNLRRLKIRRLNTEITHREQALWRKKKWTS